jgi:hypothetical protein
MAAAAINAMVGEVRFLYIGTTDVDDALDFYVEVLGATQRWRFQHFGADVAGVELGAGPLLLLADHRPPRSVLPIWTVSDLAVVRAELVAAGWACTGPLGTPEGDALVFADPTGTELAVLEVVRPDALDGAWTDETNAHRVNPGGSDQAGSRDQAG